MATMNRVDNNQRAFRRKLRLSAGTVVVLAAVGLQIFGAQSFAVGLFRTPWDKLAHLLTFTIIGSAAGVASGLTGWRRTFFCLGSALLIGIMDEWHQAYLPGRNAAGPTSLPIRPAQLWVPHCSAFSSG